MDILHLVDRLEELFNESKPFPFTHSVMVNEDRMLDLIDQMRVSIPEEIKKAQQVLANRDRLLAQAQEEAGRKIQLAQERVDQMAAQHALTQAAQAQADDLIGRAQIEAENKKREADEYVISTLSNLEGEMERVLNQVKNGIRVLESQNTKNNQE